MKIRQIHHLFSLLWVLLFALIPFARASQSYGVDLSVDLCDLRDTISVDLSGGEAWDSIRTLRGFRLLVDKDNTARFVVPQSMSFREYIDSSNVYIRYRDTEADTAKVHFHYPVTSEPSFRFDDRFEGDYCLREGQVITRRTSVSDVTCDKILFDFFPEVFTRNAEWEVLRTEVIPNARAEVTTNAYEGSRITLHRGGRVDIVISARVVSYTPSNSSGFSYFGDLWITTDDGKVIINPVESSLIYFCADQSFSIGDCDGPLTVSLRGNGTKTYALHSSTGLYGDFSLSTAGTLTYTPHRVTRRATESISYTRTYADGTAEDGVISIEVMPCMDAPLVVTSHNEICNDDPCDYDGPSILINEVMIAPKTYDGAIYSPEPRSYNSNVGGEWVELYNPDPCNAVDISDYFFGNATRDNISLTADKPDNRRDLGAGFVLPRGTIVPPRGYCVLRGEHADLVDPGRLISNGGNVVVINLVDHLDRFCLSGGGWRFWMPDQSGWFGFYDRNGIPQDAVRWGSPSDTTFVAETSPCNPGVGAYTGSLAAFRDWSASRTTHAYTRSLNDSDGRSLGRKADGGAWSDALADHTLGYTNQPLPDHRSDDRCTGSITLTPQGGEGPYTYLWDDARHQTTPTATGLCEGTYCCYITDTSTGRSRLACATISTHSVDCPDCPDETPRDTLTVSTRATSYLWDGSRYDTDGVYCHATRDAEGCDSIHCLSLTLLPPLPDDPACPSVTVQVRGTVCAGSIYRGHGFTIDCRDAVPGTLTYSRTSTDRLGCDTLTLLRLDVTDCALPPSPDPAPPCLGPSSLRPMLYFTPDGDGLHDLWLIGGIECDEYRVEIYDRFGKLLREWDGDFAGWDGTYLNKAMPSTDYWYRIVGKYGGVHVGHFSLIRQ